MNSKKKRERKKKKKYEKDELGCSQYLFINDRPAASTSIMKLHIAVRSVKL